MKRETRNRLGCVTMIMVFITTIVLAFLFGSYVGGEVTTAVGWNVTSNIVNFIIGMLSIGLILSVCSVVLAFILAFIGIIGAAIFN